MGAKTFLITVIILCGTSNLYAQLRSGEFYTPAQTKSDTTLAEISFLPADLKTYLSESKPNRSIHDRNHHNKTLRTTGWLLKNVFMSDTFDGYGYYPYESMADFNTRSVSEYNSLYNKYSIFLNN